MPDKPLNKKAPPVSGVSLGETASTPARRKTVDRRDPDSNATPISGERRELEERRQLEADKKDSKSDLLSKRQEKIQQHRKKKLLAGCEPVTGLNYEALAMDDYPSNEAVAIAKRDRDFLLALFTVCASIFVFGFTGLIPALIAGIACGIACLALALAFSSFKSRFMGTPSLSDLIQIRKELEFKALNHIRFLEGSDGLAWRCQRMRKYNSNLDRKLFNGLVMFSQRRELFSVIRNRRQIRLYLLFMIESQKAYKRLEKDYLENHFKHLDEGWNDSLSPDEQKDLVNQEESDEEPVSPVTRSRTKKAS